MSDQDLRARLIRLAYQKPELREKVLPLLAKRAKYNPSHSLGALLAEAHRTFKETVYREVESQVRKIPNAVAVNVGRSVSVDLPAWDKGQPWGANSFDVFIHVSSKQDEIWVYDGGGRGSPDKILVLRNATDLSAKEVAQRILKKLLKLAGR